MLLNYTLRDYQQACIEAFWTYLCNQQGNPVLVIPTGGGKSVVLADIFRQMIEVGRRGLLVTHRKELISQNAEKIRAIVHSNRFGGDLCGIYSAGLRSRDTNPDIVCCGIQSVYKKAFDFDRRDLLIIDEAHLVPNRDAGMYRQFIGDLLVANPHMRVCGLTATPYRLDGGLIYGKGDKIFQDVAYNCEIKPLIDAGYLCPITNDTGLTQVDTSGLHIRAGEFVSSEVEQLFGSHVIEACEQTVAHADAANRKHILIFCCSVAHAEAVQKTIIDLTGEDVGLVTGDSLPIVRSTLLDRFRSGSLRWLVNVDVLTTGFDSPNIDCIAVMRATQSPGLFAQIVGRGLRTHPSKEYCLLLDFGENVMRHGPIDHKDYGKKTAKTGGGDGEAPKKRCPACDEENPTGVRSCEFCGFTFPQNKPNHDGQADGDSPILVSERKYEQFAVVSRDYFVHTKKGCEGDDSVPQTMRVDYEVQPVDPDEQGNLSKIRISEWVCVEHDGFARNNAEIWWKMFSSIECPHVAADAVELARAGCLADITHLTAYRDGKYWRVVEYEIGDKPEFDMDAFHDAEQKRMESWDAFAYDDEEIPF